MRIVAIFLVLWELLGRLLLDARAANFVPLPSGVVIEALALLQSGDLAVAAGHSALRVLVGGGLGVVAGVAAGVLAAQGGPGRLVAAPLALLRPIPPIAWIPLTLLWFGVSEAQQVAVLAGAVFHVVSLGVEDATRRVPVALLQAAENLGASPVRRLGIRVHAALPGVLGAAREGLVMGWFVLVAAEFVSAAQGLGVLVLEGRDMLLPARTFVGMLALGGAGALTDVGLRRAQARLLRWA